MDEKHLSLSERISFNLTNEIVSSGKTRTEIAEAAGVSRSTISQYVSGRIQPTLATLSKICNYLDCSADDILCIKRF